MSTRRRGSLASLALAQRRLGFPEAAEGLATPELFPVDPVAAFDLAVLLGAPRPDVAMRDPGFLDGEREGQGKCVPVVGLHLAEGEREGGLDLPEERDAGAVV